jgi:hypothetical protein
MRRERLLNPPWRGTARLWLALLLATLAAVPAAAQCARTKVARVVALDQFIWFNRLGANLPDAMMFALEQDVVPRTGTTAGAGNAILRSGKRPRPLVLRVNAGECLQITLKNWLAPLSTTHPDTTRAVSIHVTGMQLVRTIDDDGSNVQKNTNSGLVEPGSQITYVLFAEKEGTFLLYSTAQTTGGEGDGGQIARGLFGGVNVEPAGAEYYRSQVTNADLRLAQNTSAGNPVFVSGFPSINYLAVYPTGHPMAGRPILSMLKGDTIVHADISAIITGPSLGNFAASAYANPGVPVFPDRLKPFREHTAIFHDEVGLVQAFQPIYDSTTFKFTLHAGRDAFAINYGTGGIGSEILANRFGLGPMRNCNDCKFEEFFLSSWAVGDPAMVVDTPAAADFNPNNPRRGIRATKALFPDDPSNVFHSYLNDHVKIRNLHAGPKEHHIFHLHAHQWLNTPNDSLSNYKDSQAIGPGSGYTYEMVYGGSGNRNDTPGDAIFHCHFYPHFAQGMWELWRVHDVFEAGTVLGNDGRPVAGARAYPDGEIAAGTPIPAIVPIPTYAMAPLPTDSMPGYPFYIPGVAGHRPPQPPLDLAFDGGLRRHVVTGGVSVFPQLNTTDFSKHDSLLSVRFLPQAGTDTEQVAMRWHARLGYTTPIAGAYTSTALFETNGLPPAPGAPFADPCGIRGVRMGDSIDYKAAGFQLTAFYNKANWSYSQHRMFGLWADVLPFINQQRAPEPFFFRARNRSCLTYHLVNLIPAEYKLDDFEVQTPTDIIGQHIHLVKFDVTSSDGAANGWNYEDGALSPDAVREVIRAIRRQNGCGTTANPDAADARDSTDTCPKSAFHPYFTQRPEWRGAQENIQRWWVDPVPRGNGQTSPLPTVFTHDHFGPSTHQQVGLYAGLLPEDSATTWRDPETGTALGGRFDGGPTSWRADILYTGQPTRNYREFGIQIADFASAYGREGFAGSAGRVPPINPPGKFEVGLPNLIRPPLAGVCPNGSSAAAHGCPEIVSAADPGTMLVNYRNEPLALRIRNPLTNAQPADSTGDLSLAYSTNVVRMQDSLNTRGPYAARPGTLPRDPYTPLMRTYEDDRILIRLLVGAHEEGHNWGINSTRWLHERLSPNSGFRASQMVGISEWHEFALNPLMTNRLDTIADYAYRGGSAEDDQWNGQWGVIRAYRRQQNDLFRLDTNRPVSSSLRAADLDAAAARTATPTGKTAYSTSSTMPDPNDPASWDGDVATLDAGGTAGASKLAATPTPAESDSVQAGFGNDSQGGIDYDAFEYDPDTGTDYVVTADPKAASQEGMTATTASSTTFRTEAVSTGATEYKSQPGATNVGFWGVCPRVAPLRLYEISAIPATQLPGGRLVYNTRGAAGAPPAAGGPLVDPFAVVYVMDGDLVNGRLTRNPEPLVLRANAGDCVLVRLRNRLPATLPDTAGFNTYPIVVDLFNANKVRPSARVGLHAQLVSLDVQRSDGSSVGINRNTTVAPGRWRWYQWYAGTVYPVGNGRLRATPVEFGAANLMSSDHVEHPGKGAIGALVVEPRGSKAQFPVSTSRTYANIRRQSDGTLLFREGVLLWQDDINLRFGSAAALPAYDCLNMESGSAEFDACTVGRAVGMESFAAGAAVPNTAEAEDPEDSGQKGLNYRSEPLWFRKHFAPQAELDFTRNLDFRAVLKGDSAQTPIFAFNAGDSIRIRVVQPGGHARNHAFNLHGHIWEQEPYADSSRVIADNPFSEWKGTREGVGPGEHFDVIPRHGAGSINHVPGDYLFRDQASFQFDGGIWGILRVLPPSKAITASQTGGTSCVIDARTGQTICG